MNDNTIKLSEVWGHIQCRHVLKATPGYIVFIDNEMNLDWKTSAAYEAASPQQKDKYTAIQADLMALRKRPCAELSQERQLHFKRLIGKAAAFNLEHDYPHARGMVKTAAEYLAQSQLTARAGRLAARCVTTGVLMMAGALLWLDRDALIRSWGRGAFWLILAGMAGACGSLLSLLSRAGCLQLQWRAGRLVHYLGTLPYVIMGICSGLFVVLDMQVETILAPLPQDMKPLGALSLATFTGAVLEQVSSWFINPEMTSKGKG